jgi:hypothetical protein
MTIYDIIGGSKINLQTENAFTSMQLISVDGIFSPILLEIGDRIDFEDGHSFTVQQENILDSATLIFAINTEEFQYLYPSGVSRILQCPIKIIFASPRIQYMLGLDYSTLQPAYETSNSGSPFLIITSDITKGERYTKLADGVVTRGNIGNTISNMFMYGSPFVLSGFAVQSINTSNLEMSIQTIHRESIRFLSPLKWTLLFQTSV